MEKLFPGRRLSQVKAVLALQVKRLQNLPNSLLNTLAVRLPLGIRTKLVYSLERSVPILELNLNHISPFRARIVTATHVVAEGESFVIPSVPPDGLPDGNYANPIRVHRLHDVVVDPSSGLVFADDKVIAQSSYGWRRAEDAAFLSSASARVLSAKASPEVEGPIAPLGGSVFNYYFFLIHTLPRILHIRNIEPQATVILTDPTPSFARRALQELAIPHQIIEVGAFKHDDVFICDPSYHPWPHPSNIRMLANLAEGYSADDSKHPRKIYIARKGSGRQFHNEEKLERFLQSRGYASVQLEHLPWLEQVSLLRNAKSVVSAHGAGLANVAFMRAGTEVFELTTGVWWFPSMRNIGEIAGLNHQVVRLTYEPGFPHGTAESAIEALRQHI